MEAMRGAVKEMPAAKGSIDIYEVEDLHEDMQDMLQDVEELNEVMGRSYDTYKGVDEADLDAALLDLDAELAGPVDLGPGAAAPAPAAAAAAAAPAPAAAYPSYPSFPSVPAGRPAMPAGAAPVAAGGAAGAYASSAVRM